jgi:hypothetical protein
MFNICTVDLFGDCALGRTSFLIELQRGVE